MSLPRCAVTVLALLAGVMVTSGCAGPVSTPEPDVDDAARAICTRLIGDLPRTVLNAPRRDTTGALSAAWGAPPITLTCGIAEPAAMATDTRCFEVNGVGWYAEEGEGGWLFTTIGRAVPVQLGVPNKYAPEADALVDVAAAISRHNSVHTPCL